MFFKLLGAGEEGSEPGFQLRWVGVERETREGEFEMPSCEYLRSAECGELWIGRNERFYRQVSFPPFLTLHLNSANLRECL